MTLHQPTTSDLSPARLGVVVHGHGEVVFTFGDLAVEDHVLDVDVTKSIKASGNATKKRGDVSLSSSIRVRPGEVLDHPGASIRVVVGHAPSSHRRQHSLRKDGSGCLREVDVKHGDGSSVNRPWSVTYCGQIDAPAYYAGRQGEIA